MRYAVRVIGEGCYLKIKKGWLRQRTIKTPGGFFATRIVDAVHESEARDLVTATIRQEASLLICNEPSEVWTLRVEEVWPDPQPDRPAAGFTWFTN